MTNEPTARPENAPNEPNSAEREQSIATNEPTPGPENAPNEPTARPENAPNEPKFTGNDETTLTTVNITIGRALLGCARYAAFAIA